MRYADAQRTSLESADDHPRAPSRATDLGRALLSDGGDTGRDRLKPPTCRSSLSASAIPRFPDREVVAMSAGDPQVDGSSVDVRVSAVAHGYGRRRSTFA
jgi:hypothetical protein